MTDIEKVADDMLHDMQTAWNAHDGEGFCAHLATDADFVDVMGHYRTGKELMIRAHQFIFDTIYQESEVKLTRTHTRMLTDDVAISHSTSDLTVDSGPRKGDWHSTQTMVLHRKADGWQIAAFQNTWLDDALAPTS